MYKALYGFTLWRGKYHNSSLLLFGVDLRLKF